MSSEFDLIRQYFTRPTPNTDLGVGDDAALLTPTPGHQMVVTSDMLVCGTHFFPDVDPGDLGWKTLAVNLSDLAAMGARPRWAVLALSLPSVDEAWLTAFSCGFFECAQKHAVDLIGGDTTRGPLNLCVTALGEVPAGQAISRRGAHCGDDLWVTGQPGRAALALWHLQGKQELSLLVQGACLSALHRPQPRVAFGQALRPYASAALDVSDGLAGDLRHILAQSGCGAVLHADRFPLTELMQGGIPRKRTQQAFLMGGDDYELLFTAPQKHRAALTMLAQTHGLALHRIGEMTSSPGEIHLTDAAGQAQPFQGMGYDHFG